MRGNKVRFIVIAFSAIGVAFGILGLIGQFLPSLAELGAPLWFYLVSVTILTVTSFISVRSYPPKEQRSMSYRAFFYLNATILGLLALAQLTIPLWSGPAYRLKLISTQVLPTHYLLMLPGPVLALVVIVSAVKNHHSGRLIALGYIVGVFSGLLIGYAVLGLYFIGIISLGIFVITDFFILRSEKSQTESPA